MLFRPNIFILIDFKNATFNEKIISSNVKKLTVQNLRNTTYNKKSIRKNNLKYKTKEDKHDKRKQSEQLFALCHR